MSKTLDAAVLEIASVPYQLTAVRDGERVLAYRLPRPAAPRAYVIDVTTEAWRCDCPDATYRRRECKHVRALTKALAVDA
jgi:hypothetical protein